MATEKQVLALMRLGDKAYKLAGNDLAYDVADVTNDRPYEDLTNAQVDALAVLFYSEINARRCEHCGAKIRDRYDAAQHSIVRYYDDVHGPNCGLS